jgi:hypothetical protein
VAARQPASTLYRADARPCPLPCSPVTSHSGDNRYRIHIEALAEGTRSRARRDSGAPNAGAPAGALLNRSRGCSRSRVPAAPALC